MGDPGCTPGSFEGPLVVEAAGTYVVFDVFATGGPFPLWVYEESNGLSGLQRGDEVVANEHCGAGPDTLVL